jgi:hypothetical protein
MMGSDERVALSNVSRSGSTIRFGDGGGDDEGEGNDKG